MCREPSRVGIARQSAATFRILLIFIGITSDIEAEGELIRNFYCDLPPPYPGYAGHQAYRCRQITS
jgi:hypothetical protein